MLKINVVIVDDDPMIVEINRGFVTAVPGFEVIGTASTGQETLEIIKEKKPNLTLMDIYLPDMDGVQLLQKIRELGLPVDVIAVTAANDAETVQKVFRYGAIDYIIKPFKFTRFKTALNYYYNLYSRFSKNIKLNQNEIDHLNPNLVMQTEAEAEKEKTIEKEKVEEEMPKGLNEITLKQVYQYLKEKNSPLSAEEVAIGVGLARVTARRYLDFLEKSNRVMLELQYGSVGRPINRYRTTE